MKITARMLRLSGACSSQVELFRSTFPHGAKVTLTSIEKANEAGLDVEWIARLLPEDKRAAYRAAKDSAWSAYWSAVDSALVSAFAED
jgi:hypothetical protein